MTQTTFGIKNRQLYSILALAILLWGLFGLREITNTPYSGYLTSPDSVVSTVKAGSPAAAADIQLGDRITKIDGLDVGSTALIDKTRSAIGSQQSVTLSRNGSEKTASLKLTERPLSDILLFDGAGIVVGLLSLILGLMTYLRNQNRLGSLLCLFLLGWAFAFLPAPYFSSPTVRAWAGAIGGIIVSFTVAYLLQYCLRFPEEKTILQKYPALSTLIYAAAAVVALLTCYFNIVRPSTSDRTRLMISLFIGSVFGLMFLGSVLAVVHTYLSTNAELRGPSGLNLMLIGAIIGIAPVVVSIGLSVLFPRIGETPLDRIIGILFAAVPIFFSSALMRQERSMAGITQSAAA